MIQEDISNRLNIKIGKLYSCISQREMWKKTGKYEAMFVGVLDAHTPFVVLEIKPKIYFGSDSYLELNILTPQGNINWIECHREILKEVSC